MVATRLFHVRGLGHDSGISGTRVGRARPVRGRDRFLSGRRRRVSAGAPGGDRGPRRHRARGRDGRARTEGTRRACSTFPRRVASLGFGRFRRSFSKIRVARLFHPLLRVRPRAFARAEPPRDPALRRRAHRREHVAPGVPGARGREGRGGSRSGIPPRRRVVPKRRDARKARREARSVRASRRRRRGGRVRGTPLSRFALRRRHLR